MKLGFRVGLILTFFTILICVVWIGSVQTKETDFVPVNAAEQKNKTENPTEPLTRPPTVPVKSAFKEEQLKKLNTNINKKLKENGFSGSVLVAVGDEIVVKTARGFRDIKKKAENSTDTKYEIGSITKQFTAIAVAKLAEEKKLSLTDKMAKYFPDFKAAKNVTVEQLIRMESGIPDYLNFNICAIENGERAENSVYTKKEFLKWLNSQKELGFKPGQYFYYSNTNYYMLGLIIEQVTGRTYEEFMKTEMLNPIYMYDTSLNMMDTTAQGYLLADGTKGIKIDSSYFYSAGEMVSTAEDMLRWLNAFSRGEILSEAMQKKALSPGKSGNSYGFGWFLCEDYYYHTGNTELFYAVDIVSPKEDIKIIALSNVNDTAVQGMAKEMLEITEDTLFPKEKTTKAKKA